MEESGRGAGSAHRWHRLIAVILVAALLIGCGSSAPKQYEGRMKYAGASKHGMNWIRTWIDTETGVCYAESTYGGITVMVDHDGKPYVANGWRDYD